MTTIIMQYWMKMVGSTDSVKTYAKVTARRITDKSSFEARSSGKEYEAREKVISKEEAMEYANEMNLVPVVKNEYGTIWDTEFSDFLRKYGNRIFIRPRIGA